MYSAWKMTVVQICYLVEYGVVQERYRYQSMVLIEMQQHKCIPLTVQILHFHLDHVVANQFTIVATFTIVAH